MEGMGRNKEGMREEIENEELVEREGKGKLKTEN